MKENAKQLVTFGRKISVYDALAEKKLLEKKLNKIATSEANEAISTILGFRNGCDTVYNGSPLEAAEADAKSKWKSILKQFDNYIELCGKIQESNSLTKVIIGKDTMTIADAIGREAALKLKLSILTNAASYSKTCNRKVEMQNSKNLSADIVSTNIAKLLQGAVAEAATLKLLEDQYIERNTIVLFDPNKIYSTSEELLEDVEVFIEKFHSSLVDSNIRTMIELSF